MYSDVHLEMVKMENLLCVFYNVTVYFTCIFKNLKVSKITVLVSDALLCEFICAYKEIQRKTQLLSSSQDNDKLWEEKCAIGRSVCNF